MAGGLQRYADALDKLGLSDLAKQARQASKDAKKVSEAVEGTYDTQ